MRGAMIAVAIFSLTGLTALADSGADVVVLPFENLSGAEGASRDISTLVIGAFTRKGWSVASPERLEDLLRTERVRYLDFLEGEARGRVLRETNSRAVLTGTIYEYSEERNPTVALSARLVTATGTMAWSNVAVVSSTETERVFGFGRTSIPHEVGVLAVDRLMESLPRPNGELRPTPGPEKALFAQSPTFYVAPEAMGSAPKVICVLPFVNDTENPDAARVVTDLIALRLSAAGGLSVVDSARLRSAVLELGLGSFRRVDSDDLGALAAVVGTPLFLRGTVYEYGDNFGRRGSPTLSVELILEDARTGRVVWVSQHERQGSDYEGLFLLGSEVSAVGLADRVVSEMVHAAESALRNGDRAESAGLSSRRRNDLRRAGMSISQTQTGGIP